jgi:hypothetical protein
VALLRSAQIAQQGLAAENYHLTSRKIDLPLAGESKYSIFLAYCLILFLDICLFAVYSFLPIYWDAGIRSIDIK